MAEQDRDQKTQDATPQRIKKAREDGQLGVSAEFLGGIMLASSILLFWGFGYQFFSAIGDMIHYRLTFVENMIVEPRLLVGAILADTKSMGLACLLFLIPLTLVASVGGVLQTNFNISMKPLQLDWNRLSVKSGIGRIFSIKSLVRGGLSIAKASVILLIAYQVVHSRIDEISLAGFASFKGMMFTMTGILMSAALAVAVMMLIVGVVDLVFQKWKHLEDLKMSVQEIKDEHKDSDGDPLVRARIRRLQAELGRKRMLADVPKASVVITNPTHFAVAIEYDRETMQAPVVLAKGADFLAKRIIAIAKENGVPVVERKPVARFLYANVEPGSPIPIELYQAIAEVLNFVSQVRAA